MNTLELQPISENISKTFLTDSIYRNKDIFSLLRIISNLNYNYTIAIDAEWGEGKTFFIKQCAMILDAFSNNINSNYTPQFEEIKKKCENQLIPEETIAVYYDAWANDNDEDPLFSILYSIISSQGIDVTNDRDWLDIVSSFSEIVSGVSFSNFIKNVKENDSFSLLKSPQQALKLCSEIFDKLLDKISAKRLVIFIDELDRCRPIYAVKLLERIKHYFTQNEVICIYAINSIQLQHTIKHQYGSEFNAYRYLERFFSCSYDLPHISSEIYLKYNNIDTRTLTMYILEMLSSYFNFSMRTMAQFSSDVAMIRKHFPDPIVCAIPESAKYFIYNLAIPFLTALKHYNKSDYRKFISGKSPTIFLSFVSSDKIILSRIAKIINEGIHIQTDTLSMVGHQLYDTLFLKKIPYSSEGIKVGVRMITSETQNKVKKIISLL